MTLTYICRTVLHILSLSIIAFTAHQFSSKWTLSGFTEGQSVPRSMYIKNKAQLLLNQLVILC